MPLLSLTFTLPLWTTLINDILNLIIVMSLAFFTAIAMPIFIHITKLTIFSFFLRKVIDYDFATDPTSSTVLYGDTLLLRCVPPRRYPLATTITWYKDYAVVTLGGSVSVTADYSLSITGVTRSSEGVYFCEAYNTVTRESRTSKSATITVRGNETYFWQIFWFYPCVFLGNSFDFHPLLPQHKSNWTTIYS